MDGATEIEKSSYGRALRNTVLVCLPMVLIFLLELFADLNLYFMGVFPLSPEGLPGILLSPFKHKDVGHITGNLLLLVFLLFGYFMHFSYGRYVARLAALSVIANSWLWLAGRQAWHYGASGLVYALFFFILTCALRFRKKELFAYILICFILSAGFLAGLLPYDPEISFEGHILGSVSGIMVGLFQKPVRPEKDRRGVATYTGSATYIYQYKKTNQDE